MLPTRTCLEGFSASKLICQSQVLRSPSLEPTLSPTVGRSMSDCTTHQVSNNQSTNLNKSASLGFSVKTPFMSDDFGGLTVAQCNIAISGTLFSCYHPVGIYAYSDLTLFHFPSNLHIPGPVMLV